LTFNIDSSLAGRAVPELCCKQLTWLVLSKSVANLLQELTSMAPSKADISSLKSAANHANAGLPDASLCLAVSDARDLTCLQGNL
jgi:hypothetical protein